MNSGTKKFGLGNINVGCGVNAWTFLTIVFIVFIASVGFALNTAMKTSDGIALGVSVAYLTISAVIIIAMATVGMLAFFQKVTSQAQNDAFVANAKENVMLLAATQRAQNAMLGSAYSRQLLSAGEQPVNQDDYGLIVSDDAFEALQNYN